MSYFEDLSRELIDIFLPYNTSPINTKVLHIIIMRLAGVKTSLHKPTYGCFGPCFNNRLYFEFGNITESESLLLKTWFESLGDKSVIKEIAYHNPMDEIRHYKSFDYRINIESFITKAVPLIKEYLRKASQRDLYDLQQESKNDHFVLIYQHITEMCAELTQCIARYKNQWNVVKILNQTKEALTKYRPDDFHLQDICKDLNELLNLPSLKTDKNLCVLRDRIFEHCNYVSSINLKYPPRPYPEPEVISERKNKCRLFQFFKDTVHRVEAKTKSALTCRH